MSQASQSGRPGPYERSTGGLVGAILVLVAVVLTIVLIRGTFRDTPEYESPDIDYLSLVTTIQGAGLKPVYPPALPAGWTVKDATFTPGDRPVFDLTFATDDERTVGLHQEDVSDRELVTTYVGEEATQDGDPLTTDLGTWDAWTDTDGDHAYTTEIADDTVLVYSSGDPDALRDLVESLTTDPLAT